MSYRLKRKETPRQGVRRVADEQLGRALESLREAPDRAEAVHDARKRLKKLRAVVRLVRDEVGEKHHRHVNARLRDAARRLSEARDAEVLVETLQKLRRHFDAVTYARAFDGAERELARRRDAATRALLEEGERDEQVAEELEAARAGLADWPVDAKGWSAFSGGLERVYRRGRKASAAAYESGRAEDFHEWRKRVKYLWYHLRLLQTAWPSVLEATGGEAKRLSDLLGDDHDLAVLRRTLAAEPDAFGPPLELEALDGLIAGRSAELRAEAQPLGRRLYAEKPKAFRKRIEGYWRAWQDGEGGRTG